MVGVMDAETNSKTASAHLPVACTLTDKDMTKQALEWVDLQGRATEVIAIEGGVRMTLPASMLADVEDLARREAQCCAFLRIDTSTVGDVLTLDIASANPDALPVISALAGIPLP